MLRLFKYIVFFVALSGLVNNSYGQDTLYLGFGKALDLLRSKNQVFIADKLTDNLNYSRKSIKPTEFIYSYGELYSHDVGWKLEVSQDFGNIFREHRSIEEEQITNT